MAARISRTAVTPRLVSQHHARRIWLRAQRLDTSAPFGGGPDATRAAVEHLGYVQIDTINVIERCHHHILYTRIPAYQREHLRRAQTIDKTVFEYWTHALAYVPSRDLRFFIPTMKAHQRNPMRWFGHVDASDIRRVTARIRRDGALTIRDIEDDALVDKTHPWASRKPSRHALQVAFLNGALTVSERLGMLKTYELLDRHFGWTKRPASATESQVLEYVLDRALRSQGIVSVDSICHLRNAYKPGMRRLIDAKVRAGALVPVTVEGASKVQHWAAPEVLDQDLPAGEIVHLLSPFDRLVIMRRRLQLFFGYEHRFEAYVPKEKRIFGYFALPVLVDDTIAAVVDLKTDRARKKLLMQQWTWVGKHKSRSTRRRIEEELHRFERFQLAP